jgi:hypothetical protein
LSTASADLQFVDAEGRHYLVDNMSMRELAEAVFQEEEETGDEREVGANKEGKQNLL